MVYAHFGIEVISEILKKEAIIVDSKSLLNLYSFVYEGFVEEIDAIDNGIPMYSEGKPRYTINTHLSARINRLNPDWNSPEPDCTDELFKKAMEIVGHEFLEKILFVSIFILITGLYIIDFSCLYYAIIIILKYKCLLLFYCYTVGYWNGKQCFAIIK